MSLPEEQLYADFEMLMDARRALAGGAGDWGPPGADGSWYGRELDAHWPPAGQRADGAGGSPTHRPCGAIQELVGLLAGILEDAGCPMALMDLCNQPGVSEARKGIARDMNKFLAKFPELFSLEDEAVVAGQPPKGKLVTLVGTPPPRLGKGAKRHAPWSSPVAPGVPAQAENPNFAPEMVEAKREEVLDAIIELLEVNGGEMTLINLGQDKRIGELKRGVVNNLSKWFSKISSSSGILELFDGAPDEEGKPPIKMVRLADDWRERLSAQPPAKRPRVGEAPALAAGVMPDPEATTQAVEQLGQHVQERLSEVGSIRLQDLAEDASVKDIRKDIPKRRKLAEILRSLSQGRHPAVPGPGAFMPARAVMRLSCRASQSAASAKACSSGASFALLISTVCHA
ncbi:unnamed protein product [Prorocentrum cordatum]|uniref:TFIIS N-terminal domain-containing protein n=1 Tax=Prorocentrum cordatum TaxID=2364126 RepID=A0ABN9PLH1_9DINO|nr:unnamed protein product [Polarella glacialis]